VSCELDRLIWLKVHFNNLNRWFSSAIIKCTVWLY